MILGFLLEAVLEKEMATHSSTFAWKIPWMEEPGGLQSMGLRREGHNLATKLKHIYMFLHFFSIPYVYFTYLWVDHNLRGLFSFISSPRHQVCYHTHCLNYQLPTLWTATASIHLLQIFSVLNKWPPHCCLSLQYFVHQSVF